MKTSDAKSSPCTPLKPLGKFPLLIVDPIDIDTGIEKENDRSDKQCFEGGKGFRRCERHEYRGCVDAAGCWAPNAAGRAGMAGASGLALDAADEEAAAGVPRSHGLGGDGVAM